MLTQLTLQSPKGSTTCSGTGTLLEQPKTKYIPDYSTDKHFLGKCKPQVQLEPKTVCMVVLHSLLIGFYN